MIDGKSVLAIIPARAGSKGILNKNIIDLNGKPLIAYSIIAAKKSKYIDNVFVSTDSTEIARVAEEYHIKVPYLRPQELASDEAKTIDVMCQCIETLKKANLIYDIIILLQPTQPLRTHVDIDDSLEMFIKSCGNGLVSVSEVTDPPILVRTINDQGILEPLFPNQDSTIRRQDMKKYYRVNGVIYINLVTEINKNLSLNDNKIPYIIDKSKSIDIDEELDLLLASAVLKSVSKE